MKLFKIIVLLTYVFDVTIVILHNVRAQLLTFQNGVFSQDLCYSSVISKVYGIIAASGMISRLL